MIKSIKKAVGFSLLVIPYLLLAIVGHIIIVNILVGAYSITALLLAVGD